MVKADFHDPLDAESVDIPHGEVLDIQVLQDLAVINKIRNIKNGFRGVHKAFMLTAVSPATRGGG